MDIVLVNTNYLVPIVTHIPSEDDAVNLFYNTI